YKVKIEGPTTRIEITAIGPLGDVHTDALVISYPFWKRLFEKEEQSQILEKKNEFSTGLGITVLSYKQTSKSDVSLISSTFKGSYDRNIFNPNWALGASVFTTAVNFKNNIAGTSVRFLGFNLRLGYRFSFLKHPWDFILFGGGYYSTMFVTQCQFGYTNVYGPQIFPVIKRMLSNGHIISSYLKISPVTDGFSVIKLSTREIATGVNYAFQLKNKSWVALSFDYANLVLYLSGNTARVNSYTLGGSYKF
ncbi:MAG: hypothetical protein HY843_01760, partial [Bdellovibrio sp.]|nr:hypothetical protein [Bdellovibrio sp.]